jgi:GDPmannose 4,6-dehydratase
VPRKALITGIAGQSGSFLAEILLAHGYEVHGLIRQSATPRTQNIAHLLEPVVRVQLHYGDITDTASLMRVLLEVQPDEVYNLAAQAHVKVSFDNPVYTGEATGLGALRLLEAARLLDLIHVKFYQASSSEMFGAAPPPQDEDTKFRPRSPYAAAKVYAYHVAQNYREAYGMYIVNGVLFNHESARRAQHYVTRKVTLSVARIAAGLQHELRLGNLDAKRDWGYAPEYAEGMRRMLQEDRPNDYVLATGEMHSVQELVEVAFERVGLDWQKYVRIDQSFLRPTEVNELCGDASKAKAVLDWVPRTKFKQLIELMVDADLELVRKTLS